jgi:thiol-disulfide isomerase/thioredoxin
MTKKWLALCAAGIVLFSSCEEKPPIIDMGGGAPQAKDTAYMANVEAPQAKNVVVEEFTGATCPNCPAAREVLQAVVDANPGRVFPIEIHINNFLQSRPAHDAKYDLRTEDGTNISANVYSTISVMPSAGVDRVTVGTERLLNTGKWAATIASQMAKATPVNLTVSSEYDEATKVAVIKVKAAYTSAVSAKQYMTIALIEDDIVDIQEYPDRYENNYTFKHTLRDIITSVNGDEILADKTSKDPGQVYERTILYNVSENYTPANCKVVVYVHNSDGSNKEVLQSAEVKLKK